MHIGTFYSPYRILVESILNLLVQVCWNLTGINMEVHMAIRLESCWNPFVSLPHMESHWRRDWSALRIHMESNLANILEFISESYWKTYHHITGPLMESILESCWTPYGSPNGAHIELLLRSITQFQLESYWKSYCPPMECYWNLIGNLAETIL